MDGEEEEGGECGTKYAEVARAVLHLRHRNVFSSLSPSSPSPFLTNSSRYLTTPSPGPTPTAALSPAILSFNQRRYSGCVDRDEGQRMWWYRASWDMKPGFGSPRGWERRRWERAVKGVRGGCWDGWWREAERRWARMRVAERDLPMTLGFSRLEYLGI